MDSTISTNSGCFTRLERKQRRKYLSTRTNLLALALMYGIFGPYMQAISAKAGTI
jgi:hypothetical protein